MSKEYPVSLGTKLSSTFTEDGAPQTARTIVLSRSQVEGNHTSLQEVFYLCVGGVVLSLLITKAMMILCGTWGEESEKSLDMILGSGSERSLIAYGIGSWFTKTGQKEENK